MALLTVEALSFTYAGSKEPVLSECGFSMEKGDFVTLFGPTGCGKSTLLRLLKREIAPKGTMSGRILFEGTELSALSAADSCCRIGYVTQRPDEQLVTDKVWHELAFGLENMGLKREIIRSRVAEMVSYFGMEAWFEKPVAELSGGQKQLLNLASVMVMQPDLLLLDEPTSQLDPIAASDFIATLSRLNRDLSLTILVSEHRLEELLPISGRILAMKDGRIIEDGETRRSASRLACDPAWLPALPAASRLSSLLDPVDIPADLPLTVSEGRKLAEGYRNRIARPEAKPEAPVPHPKETASLVFEDVCFRYHRASADVLKGISFSVREGEIFCLLGGNGSGKSTTLSVAAALHTPYAGRVKVFGKEVKKYPGSTLYESCLALLPQDVQTLFLCDTVEEELKDAGLSPDALPYDLPFPGKTLADRHPYDLSGGQQQLLALAKILASRPRLLLLDEPTKGLDPFARMTLQKVLLSLKQAGVTLVLVTHDVEFAAVCSDRCALLFRGEITSCDTPRAFFSGNSFYTTAACRMTRGHFESVLTVEEAASLCRLNGKKEENMP